MPRSGTTILFEAVASHRDVGWFSQYFDAMPSRPELAFLGRTADVDLRFRRSVARSDQGRRMVDRLFVGPSEAYRVWERCCGERFRYDYLLGIKATEGEVRCMRKTVSKVLRYQGKSRFAAKITGPGRIEYLSSIFPDARFVHVVRDGRAVARSLMKVPFWKERNRMQEPAWRGGLTAGDDKDWVRHNKSPIVLAALQWRRVVESIREEALEAAPGRYIEVRYEVFVSEPAKVLTDIWSFCDLSVSRSRFTEWRRRNDTTNMNVTSGGRIAFDDGATLDALLGQTLTSFGYEMAPAIPNA